MSNNEFKVPELPTKAKSPIPLKETSDEVAPNGAQVPKLPYKKPEWSALPKKDYSMEIIKNGVIIETFNIPDSEEFIVLGRLPLCNVQMDHPSISRYHAVIQFSNKGMPYLYDLGSAHGTFLNKNVLPPNQYIPLHVGDMIKFGQSTRIYIFQGPNEEEIKKSEEMYEKYQEMKKKKLEELNKKKEEEEDDDDGISWGFGEDAKEETIEKMEDIRADYKPNENAFYYKDPKKALRNWLENRGSEMEFQIAEETHSHAKLYIAKVVLPLEDSYGPVSVTGSGLKKKDAEKEAALNACIKIDQYIGFKAPIREKKNKHNSDDESDNDTFYDRTGQVEKKKKLLKQKKAHKKEEVDTHESLIKKSSIIDNQILEIQEEIEEAKKQQLERSQPKEEEDYDLDNYMNSLNKSLNKKKIRPIHVLNKELENLKKEKERIIKLLRITRPNIDVFTLMQQSNFNSKNEEDKKDIIPINTSENHDSTVDEKKDINIKETSSDSNKEMLISNKRGYDEISKISSSSENQENKKQKLENEKDNNSDYNNNEKNSNKNNNTEEKISKKEKKEKNKRKFGPINKETSELLDNQIKEDIIDWLPPEQRDKEYNNMNAEYGY